MSDAISTEENTEKALEPAPAAQQQPMLAGTFAIFEDSKGGFYLFTDTGDGPQRKHIPAGLVKMVTGGGLLGRKFASIFGD